MLLLIFYVVNPSLNYEAKYSVDIPRSDEESGNAGAEGSQKREQ